MMDFKYLAQCLACGKHSVNINYDHLHQNHGADGFVLGERKEKKKRIRTKSGEPTSEEKEVISKGV